MYEKTCDKKIRLEKVNKVKTKILAEIEKELKLLKEEIESGISEEYYVYCIKQSFSLFALKDYINSKYTFMDWEAMNDEFVVYKISDEQLNIFLQSGHRKNFAAECFLPVRRPLPPPFLRP